EVKNLSKRFGLATAVLSDGVLICPDDGAELVGFDANDGKVLWRYSYGTVARGAPLVADGKLFIFDVQGALSILKLNGRKRPEELDKINFKPKSGRGGTETHGTPIAVNGRLYFCTRDFTYCVGGAEGRVGKLPAEWAETPPGPAVSLRLEPAEI